MFKRYFTVYSRASGIAGQRPITSLLLSSEDGCDAAIALTLRDAEALTAPKNGEMLEITVRRVATQRSFLRRVLDALNVSEVAA